MDADFALGFPIHFFWGQLHAFHRSHVGGLDQDYVGRAAL